MKSYNKLKAKMELFQRQVGVSKKNECDNELKEVNHLCNEFGFTDGMLKSSLAEGRQPKEK